MVHTFQEELLYIIFGIVNFIIYNFYFRLYKYGLSFFLLSLKVDILIYLGERNI